MIIKCESKDKKRILNYIGANYSSCLYLYLDFIKYGLDSDEIKVYIQQDKGEILSVLLQYYSCLHVYSKFNNLLTNEVATFFGENGFTMLYSTVDTARLIYESFVEVQKKCFSMTTGWVAQIKNIDKEPLRLSINAEKKDFAQIAQLIYEDEDIGKSYNYDELLKQLEERNQQGYARNRIIKQDGIVIAHACTNAELENLAVVAELLVHKDYRRKGYATEIWRGICGELIGEGKEVYSFYYSEESRKLHRRIGFVEVCEWAKIVRA